MSTIPRHVRFSGSMNAAISTMSPPMNTPLPVIGVKYGFTRKPKCGLSSSTSATTIIVIQTSAQPIVATQSHRRRFSMLGSIGAIRW